MNDFVYDPLDYAQYPTGGTQFGYYNNLNREFYGTDHGTDWKDSTKFAYEQVAQREANAFDVAIMNYQNQYNSPLEQMKRYQAAGLNPMDALGKAVESAPISHSGAAQGSSHAPTWLDKVNAVQDTLQTIVGAYRAAADVARSKSEIAKNDAMLPYYQAQGLAGGQMFGQKLRDLTAATDLKEAKKIESAAKTLSLGRDVSHKDIVNEWLRYYYGTGKDPRQSPLGLKIFSDTMVSGQRAKYLQNQNIHYPDKVAYLNAVVDNLKRKGLQMDYELAPYGLINTGNDTVDAFLIGLYNFFK